MVDAIPPQARDTITNVTRLSDLLFLFVDYCFQSHSRLSSHSLLTYLNSMPARALVFMDCYSFCSYFSHNNNLISIQIFAMQMGTLIEDFYQQLSLKFLCFICECYTCSTKAMLLYRHSRQLIRTAENMDKDSFSTAANRIADHTIHQCIRQFIFLSSSARSRSWFARLNCFH